MKALDVIKGYWEGNTIKGKFFHANLNEANLGIDSIQEKDFPVFVYISGQPFDSVVEEESSGVPTRTISIFGFALTKLPNRTTEYNTEDTQPYIDGMQRRCDQLITLLNADQLTEGAGIAKYKMTATYSKFDSSLVGITLQFDWLTNEGYRICTNE